MNRRLRPLPYPPGSLVRRYAVAYLREERRLSYRESLACVSALNQKARLTPRPGEKCGAKTRRGTPCQCKAGPNGRCKFHGGMSTGPKTARGKQIAARNLPAARR